MCACGTASSCCDFVGLLAAHCPSSSHLGMQSELEGAERKTGQEERDQRDNRRNEQDPASSSKEDIIIVSERSPGEGNGNPL